MPLHCLGLSGLWLSRPCTVQECTRHCLQSVQVLPVSSSQPKKLHPGLTACTWPHSGGGFSTHLSPEDFIYTDLPLHSGPEYPNRFLHSNCLSLQNLFINSRLCLFPYLFPQRLEETVSVLLSAIKQVSNCARHQVSAIDFA